MAEAIYRPRIDENVQEWKELLKFVRKQGVKSVLDSLQDTFVRVEKKEKEDSIELDGYSVKIKTIDDLIAFHQINTKKWKADEITANYWEQGSKLPNGTIATTPLHQIKARFKIKNQNVSFERLKESLDAVVKKATQFNYDVPARSKSKKTKDLVVEIMITDLHLGKIGFDYKTMDYNWGIKECEQAYMDCINNTLSQVDIDNIDHFILPTGNDLLNIDSAKNTTTRGTEQMTGAFWEHLFERSIEMIIKTINTLSKIAPVHVPFVRGNHDSQSVYSLGSVINRVFSDNESVTVDNDFQKRKYHTFGEVLIGYYHFDKVKPNNAHNSIIADVPEHADKKFKAVHGGHFHKNMKRLLKPHDIKDEQFGIEIEVCPSLSPTDQWHYENLYVGNLRRSKTFVWHKRKGLIKELYFNL